MISQVLCCMLIWSCYWTTVSAVPSSQEVGLLRSTGEDFIDVTCTPVEVDGAIECKGSPYLPNQIYSFFADLPNPNPVECRVDLHTDVLDLPNVCQELPYKPGLTRCTATIPRHIHIITYCRMEGATRAVGSAFTSAGRLECNRECETYNGGKCVVNEDCRLCIRDFRKIIPNANLKESGCEIPYEFNG